MSYSRMKQRKKALCLGVMCVGALMLLVVRLGYIMLGQSAHYTQKAQELHERERYIKALRGRIIDSTGTILADNKAVCTVSVIRSQIKDKEKVIETLCRELSLPEEYIRKRVEKRSAREIIKNNIDKETGDRLRRYELSGVKIDEDYRRYYPFESIASKVLGFTGADNQGILGLEAVYDKYLTGKNGEILTITDAKGIEQLDQGERRVESEPGNDIYVTLDINIQTYATQLAKQAYETKQAKSVSIIVMNVNNGDVLAMVNYPEYNLNEPFNLDEYEAVDDENRQILLNEKWRNGCINDTYEPGSIFKIITAAAGLESNVVTLQDQFSCPGYIVVDDRKIRCHKIAGHGAEDFIHATMNSCNPVFITVGLRIGAERFLSYFKQFKLMDKTGIDLPGEARTIMHKLEDIGNVELATISFGQSFQVTPIRLLTTVSSLINGGKTITPHLVSSITDREGKRIKELTYTSEEGIVSADTTEKLKLILEQVVENGGGKNGYVEGYRVGGKTATSQTLPRGSGRYIASFLGFAPANDPKVIAIAIIDNPQGMYYGGQIAAPIIRQLFENILPYLDELDYN